MVVGLIAGRMRHEPVVIAWWVGVGFQAAWGGHLSAGRRGVQVLWRPSHLPLREDFE